MKAKIMICILGMLLLGASSAMAEYTVQLGTVLVDSSYCSFIEGAFQNLSTDEIKVDASCSFGSFTGSNGLNYDSEITSSMTVHDEGIGQLQLGTVLVDSSDCAFVQSALQNLSTDEAYVHASCSFGSYTGSNGLNYDSEVTTSVDVHRH